MQWGQAAKYLAGECSVEERRRFEQWLAADPARASALESVRPYFARPGSRPRVDVEAAWAAVAARIEREELGVQTGGAGGARRKTAVRWRDWGIAAAALAAVAAGVSLAIRPDEADRFRTAITTGAGEKRSLTLRDGSRVVLAPSSRFELRGDRDAKLEGEAYFVVVHDSRRPFTVQTSHARVVDLGTAFVVRADSVTGSAFVAVEEGIVSLGRIAPSEPGESLMLRAGESGAVSPSGVSRSDSAAWDSGLAWTRGEIAFDDAPMRDVAAELSRWFGVSVRLSDPALETRTLSARLAGESLDEALDAIASSLGVRHKRTGDTVTFYP